MFGLESGGSMEPMGHHVGIWGRMGALNSGPALPVSDQRWASAG